MNGLTSAQRAPWQPLLVALAAAAACGAARADEPSPYFIGVTQSLTHDSNVYRAPNRVSDNYSSTGLVGGFDQPIGRQRVYANASVQLNKYQGQTTLDNTSYNTSLGWDFATLMKISGGLSFSASQSLANANNTNTLVPSTDRNLAQTEQFAARAAWGGDGALTLNTAYSHSRVHYSAPAFASSESSQDSFSLGSNYRVGATLNVGAGLRMSRSVSPQGVQVSAGVFEENTSKGQNIDLLADWRPTALTSTSARLSWTKQSNSRVGNRDFSGLTGALSATYAPTAKLGFNASLARDAGTNASFFNLTNPITGTTATGLSESSQTTNSLTVGATYAATAKISVNAGAQWRRSNLVDSFTVAGNGSNNERNDETKSLSLGANYAFSRALTFGCSLSHLTRNASASATFAGFSYSADTANCIAQFTLR